MSVLFLVEFDHDYESDYNPESLEGPLGNPGYGLPRVLSLVDSLYYLFSMPNRKTPPVFILQEVFKFRVLFSGFSTNYRGLFVWIIVQCFSAGDEFANFSIKISLPCDYGVKNPKTLPYQLVS